jgi:TRAP-type C4-dicarboxylate transport system permease small subunit
MLWLLKAYDRFVHWLVSLAFAAGAAAMVAIMILGTVDVASTYLFRHPVPASLEIQEVLLAVIIFLGLGHAQAGNNHIEVDLFTSSMSERLRRLCRLVGLIVGAFVFAVISIRSWGLAMSSLKAGETASALFAFPIYPGKFLVAIGAGIAALECLRQILARFSRQTPAASDNLE